MTILLHILVTAFCAFECAAGMFNPRGAFTKILMFAGLGLIHGIVPILTPGDMTWASATNRSIQFAALMALLGVVALSVGWRWYESRWPQWRGLSPGLDTIIARSDGQQWLRRMFWVCAVLSVAAWLGALVASAGSLTAAFEAGRFEHRYAGNIYLSVILNHLSNLIVVPALVCFFLPRRYRLWGVSFALVLAVMFFWGTKGTRAMSLGMIGTLVMGYTLRHHIRPHRLLLIAAGGVVLVLLSIATYEIRKVMSQRTLRQMGAMVVTADTYSGAITRDPLNYHQFLVAAVEHFPRDHPYLHGATYRRLLFFLLPQEVFPWLKPPDTHNTFARVITTFSSDATIPPTMIGDGYINFWGPGGVFGVMLINGVVLGFVSRKMRESPLWFIFLAPTYVRVVLLAVRGSPYEIVTTGVTSLALLWALSICCGFSIRRAGAEIQEINGASTPADPLAAGAAEWIAAAAPDGGFEREHLGGTG